MRSEWDPMVFIKMLKHFSYVRIKVYLQPQEFSTPTHFFTRKYPVGRCFSEIHGFLYRTGSLRIPARDISLVCIRNMKIESPKEKEIYPFAKKRLEYFFSAEAKKQMRQDAAISLRIGEQVTYHNWSELGNIQPFSEGNLRFTGMDEHIGGSATFYFEMTV